jgi:hypothetical protein
MGINGMVSLRPAALGKVMALEKEKWQPRSRALAISPGPPEKQCGRTSPRATRRGA